MLTCMMSSQGSLSIWQYDAGGTAQEMAGLVVKLYSHRHPAAVPAARQDTLAGLCNASSSLPAPALMELLRVITQSDSAWEVNDQSALASLIDLIESACMRCFSVAASRLTETTAAQVQLF